MNAMRERIILEKTVKTANGRTVIQERKACGVLDADGAFHLRAYCGRRFLVQWKSEKDAKNRGKAA